MKDSLLLVVVLALFFFGYAVMDRLDRFLAEERMKGSSEDRCDGIFGQEGDEEIAEKVWPQPLSGQTEGGKRRRKVV